MKYLFYPGCSAEGSALEYKVSTLKVLEVLGAEVEELDGWTCCGASAASVKSDLLGLTLPARNLALAEQVDGDRAMIAICSACYTNFRRTSETVSEDPSLLSTVNKALEVEGLTFHNTVRTRHLMDVLATDFTPEEIAAKVERPLTGLSVAPYYGCQTVRPYSPYDDDEKPTSMIAVLEALGAEVHRHNRGAACCGTSLMMTKPKVGYHMAGEILAACGPADCVAAVCPMCHMNLDSYQEKASRVMGQELHIPILFLPQLMGLAFGLPSSELLLERHVVPVKAVLTRLAEAETTVASN
jgi:heterodisulfide reductase subunit B